MDLELKDKVAVITGGSIGIGLAVAEGLAAEGVHVVIVAREAGRVLTEAARVAKKFGVRSLGVPADVATVGAIEQVVVETEREFGGADILINNAGTGGSTTGTST
jgi:3-oxoacyl-[acyl-carrier protein] reductase